MILCHPIVLGQASLLWVTIIINKPGSTTHTKPSTGASLKAQWSDSTGCPKYSKIHGLNSFSPLTFPYLLDIHQEEQSLCFLGALQNIHLGQPRITFPSPFRVAGVGRSIITRF